MGVGHDAALDRLVGEEGLPGEPCTDDGGGADLSGLEDDDPVGGHQALDKGKLRGSGHKGHCLPSILIKDLKKPEELLEVSELSTKFGGPGIQSAFLSSSMIWA